MPTTITKQIPYQSLKHYPGEGKKKNLIFNAFLMGSAGCQTISNWTYPNDTSAELYTNPDFWSELATLLERGKINAVFFADVLGPYDVYKGPGNVGPVAKVGSQFPVSDPTYFIPLMAAVTSKLAFGVTMSTMSEHPYHLARRLGTLDLITNGRVGWNVVTSYLESASKNLLNGQELSEHKKRYDRAEEYVDVIYKLLLSSWQDGALKLDKTNGVFTDPNGVRHIDHVGDHFKVSGPAFTQPSSQKLPVIIQAGTSTRGKELAARNAEVVFLGSFTPQTALKAITEIKEIAKKKYARDASKIRFLAKITVIIGKTHEQAEAKMAEIKSNGDDEGAKAMFSGWTGIDIDQFKDNDVLTDVDHLATASAVRRWQDAYPRVEKWTKRAIIEEIKISGSGPVIVGTVEEVADEIQNWVDVCDIDGFNLAYTLLPQYFEDIVNELLPELRARGLASGDYPSSSDEHLTFREQLIGQKCLDQTHPAENLTWRANESKEEFEARLPEALLRLKGKA
ncbi:related to thermophilic desulfurizing enzyme [Zygosaccharomyces bailii]|nr:related to thermophilic desulfurizing enzyme [Zygosaccharomyces bailii]